MSEHTNIAWTDATWNPWHGCEKVSPGCKHCYMYREKQRYGQDPRNVTRSKTTFRAPLKWTKPARVFTCSWSDFFIEEADPWRDEAWEIIRQTPHLTYQILTKRPERMAGRLPWTTEPWPHVWLGVSVEDQANADARIPLLLDTPAAVRFLSVEPLLAAVDLRAWLLGWCPKCKGAGYDGHFPTWGELRDGRPRGRTVCPRCRTAIPDVPLEERGDYFYPALHWLIVGGESGGDARPCDVDWVRCIVTQCRDARVPCFVKQLGAHFLEVPPGRPAPGERPGQKWRRNWFKHRAGADPSEWPEDLRIQEFPVAYREEP